MTSALRSSASPPTIRIVTTVPTAASDAQIGRYSTTIGASIRTRTAVMMPYGGNHMSMMERADDASRAHAAGAR